MSSMNREKRALALFALLVAGFTVSVWLSRPRPASQREKADAIARARLAVDAKLEDPAGTFHSWGIQATQRADGSYRVESPVDAKNRFGGSASADKQGNVERVEFGK